MKIFKNWFSKQDKKEYQDDIGDSDAAIILIAKRGEESVLNIHFQHGYENEMAELIFLFNSGSLLGNCVEVLRDACQDDSIVLSIVQKSEQIAHNLDSQESELDLGPLIDPCHVFRKGDDEFKG